MDKLLQDAIDGVSGEVVLENTQARCRDLSWRVEELTARVRGFMRYDQLSKAELASDSESEQYLNQALMSAEAGLSYALCLLSEVQARATQARLRRV